MGRILEIKNLKKTFYKNKKPYTAVDEISFYMEEGSCVGIVGESGCGKSTTAKMITRLAEPDSGRILLNGHEVIGGGKKDLKELYRNVQMVFQSPQDSFDPRCTLGDGIMESMLNNGMKKKDAKIRVKDLLSMVELEPEYADRYPHEVSGGQCQRAAIARALAVNPRLLICDEATSALDVTVQAQILKLLKKLREEIGLSILMICHDLALVQNFCDYVLVMYRGKIVEEGVPDEIIQRPKEEYTKMLVNSVF